MNFFFTGTNTFESQTRPHFCDSGMFSGCYSSGSKAIVLPVSRNRAEGNTVGVWFSFSQFGNKNKGKAQACECPREVRRFQEFDSQVIIERNEKVSSHFPGVCRKIPQC